MGYHDERKAREQGEEAFCRGYGRTSNPHGRCGGHDEDLCRREWDEGYRQQERLEEDRREEEEEAHRREAHLAEQRTQAYEEERQREQAYEEGQHRAEEEEWELDEEE